MPPFQAPLLRAARSAAGSAATRRAMGQAAGPRTAAAAAGPPAKRGMGVNSPHPSSPSLPRRPLPPRAKGGSAAMRELMQSRDDRRADKLEAKAPTVTSLPEWSRPLAVIQYPDPRLRAVNAIIGSFDADLAALAKEMLGCMYDDAGGSRDSGVGLAAPQVGVNVRLMVFNPTGEASKPEQEVVLVNPRVVSTGGGLEVGEEGCLSFPGIYGDVARPARVKVRAQRLDGTTFQLVLEGFPARVFLHEFDHLQGVLFHERMEPAAAEKAGPLLRGLEGGWEKTAAQG